MDTPMAWYTPYIGGNIHWKKCEESALSYLLKKRGSKGSEIKYTKLEMPSYLLPNNEYKIDDQRYVYGMRNKMADIPSSFTAKEKSNQNATAIKLKTLNILYTTVKIWTAQNLTHISETSFQKP